MSPTDPRPGPDATGPGPHRDVAHEAVTAREPRPVEVPRTADDDHQHGDRSAAMTAGRSAMLAPFVAWMATQSLDESTRRRHREAVEAYLGWCEWADGGPASGRRRRYEDHLRRHVPGELNAATRAGLDQYAAYQQLRARTLPIDQ